MEPIPQRRLMENLENNELNQPRDSSDLEESKSEEPILEKVNPNEEEKIEDEVNPEELIKNDIYLKLHHVDKVYDNKVQAVFDFNLDVKKHEFVVLVGPSGCGKSTTIRMIAGLEQITNGDLYINGKYANDLSPKDRDIAMVFQNYALYPQMTVYDNMAFGLKMRHVPKEEIDKRVKTIAETLQLIEYLDRKPKNLSGGQRQRVALGRAIVRDAKIFLMDEPLSNLDAKLRVSMRSEIVKLHNDIGATTIYVTHDQTEAMTMATKVVVLNKGWIQQIGSPEEIYNKPENIFVATFIGSPSMNMFEGKLVGHTLTLNDGKYSIDLDSNIVEEKKAYFEKQDEKIEKDLSILVKLEEETKQKLNKTWQFWKKKKIKKNLENTSLDVTKKKELLQFVRNTESTEELVVIAGIRPENLEIVDLNDSKEGIEAEVTVAELLGNRYLVHLNLFGKEAVIECKSSMKFQPKMQVKVLIDKKRIHVFDRNTQGRIH